MTGSKRNLTLTFGTFTCAVVGFDDPFEVQLKALEAIRKLAKLSPDFGAATRPTDLAYIKHVMMRHFGDADVTANLTDSGIEFCRSTATSTPDEIADAPKSAVRNGGSAPLILTNAQASQAGKHDAPNDDDRDQASEAEAETDLPQDTNPDDEPAAKGGDAESAAQSDDEAAASADEDEDEDEDEDAPEETEDIQALEEEEELAKASGGEANGLLGRKFATSEKSARLSRLSGFFEGQKNVYDFSRHGVMTPTAAPTDDDEVAGDDASEVVADAAQIDEISQADAAQPMAEPVAEESIENTAAAPSGPRRPLRIIRNEPLNTDLSGIDDDEDLDPLTNGADVEVETAAELDVEVAEVAEDDESSDLAEADPTPDPYIDDDPDDAQSTDIEATPLVEAKAATTADAPLDGPASDEPDEPASADTASEAAEPEPETEPEPEPVSEIEFVDDGTLNLRNFAHRTGAATLPEILEVSAAYATLVDEQNQFSRRHLLDMANQITRSDQFSAEDHIRSFGKLLRSGAIKRVADGNFMVSTPVRNKYLKRMEDW